MRSLRRFAQYLSRPELSIIEIVGLMIAVTANIVWWQSLLILVAASAISLVVSEVSK